MRIESLELENIRNIRRLAISLTSPVTVFLGKNAQGKTTILEAIHFLSIGKSLRRGPAKSIISQGVQSGRIKGKFVNDDGEKIEVEFILGREKTPKLNGARKRLSDIIGEIHSVLFTAEDLVIIESPQKRRRFINILLSQIDKQYLLSLMEYQHVLKRRNKLLFMIKSGGADGQEISFWDSKIGELTETIVSARKDIIAKINSILSQSPLFRKKELKISYRPSLSNREDALKELEKRREKEIILCQTTLGPHRDNINFHIGKLNLNFHGSRGEKRSAIVELKRAEIKLLSGQDNELPILLLDDVFSELDDENKKLIIDAIDKEQTIMTTTNEKEFGKILDRAKIYKVNDGGVKEV